jgi:O-succinylbenzoate synthase
MKIERVELYLFEIPYVTPFETSFKRSYGHQAIIAKVFADGLVGWGECVAEETPSYSPESNITAWYILKDFLIPDLLAVPVNDPREVPERFKRPNKTEVRGHNMAKACLEGAIWDIAAQQDKLSLRDYIGKVTGQPMKNRVSVGVSIGIQASPEKLVETIAGYKADGYGRFKIKIKPGHDIADTVAARKAFPNDLLQVDANSAYHLEDAVEIFPEMDDLNLLLIEQPLDYYDIYEHHKLQKILKTPICLDESIHSARDAQAAIELGSCKIINIKQGRLGGLTEAIRVHNACAEAGMPVWCGGMLETGIGRALNLALAAMPNFKLPSDLSASKRYYNPDIVEPEFELNDDSTLSVPTGMGLGVNVVPERLKKVTIKSEKFK